MPEISSPGEDRRHPRARGRGGDRRRALRGCAGCLRSPTWPRAARCACIPSTAERPSPARARRRSNGRRTRPALDTVLVAVGGGGLIAGMASWWAGRVKVVGVEPEGSRALHAALEAGRPGRCDCGFGRGRFARRQEHRRSSSMRSAREAVDHVALVADEAIRDAQWLLWRDYRIASRARRRGGAGRADLGRLQAPPGERVGVLLCGGQCRTRDKLSSEITQPVMDSDVQFPAPPDRRLPALRRRPPAARAEPLRGTGREGPEARGAW